MIFFLAIVESLYTAMGLLIMLPSPWNVIATVALGIATGGYIVVLCNCPKQGWPFDK